MTAEGLHSKQGWLWSNTSSILSTLQLLGFLSCMKTKAFTFWNSSALHSLSLFLCFFPPSNPVWSLTVSEAGQEFTTAPQVGLKLTIFLPQSPEYRHDRHKPRYLSLEPRGLLRCCKEVMTVCILDKHPATELPLGCLLVHSWWIMCFLNDLLIKWQVQE